MRYFEIQLANYDENNIPFIVETVHCSASKLINKEEATIFCRDELEKDFEEVFNVEEISLDEVLEYVNDEEELVSFDEMLSSQPENKKRRMDLTEALSILKAGGLNMHVTVETKNRKEEAEALLIEAVEQQIRKAYKPTEVVPPCNIGDVAYLLTINGDIRELTVTHIDIKLRKNETVIICRAVFDLDGDGRPCEIEITPSKIGEIYFFSLAAAEKALKEREKCIESPQVDDLIADATAKSEETNGNSNELERVLD